MTTEPPKINVPALRTKPLAFSPVLRHNVLMEGTRYVGNSTIKIALSFFKTVLVSTVLTKNAIIIPKTYKLNTTKD